MGAHCKIWFSGGFTKAICMVGLPKINRTVRNDIEKKSGLLLSTLR